MYETAKFKSVVKWKKKIKEALCTLPLTHNPDDEDEDVLDHICGTIRGRFTRSF